MALPAHGQYEVLLDVWTSMAASGKSNIQDTLDCCGFSADSDGPSCYTMDDYLGPVS